MTEVFTRKVWVWSFGTFENNSYWTEYTISNRAPDWSWEIGQVNPLILVKRINPFETKNFQSAKAALGNAGKQFQQVS
jgi:hypothetical protein